MTYFAQHNACRRSDSIKIVSRGFILAAASVMSVACSNSPAISQQPESAVLEPAISEATNAPARTDIAEAIPLESDADKAARNYRTALISKLADEPTAAEMEQAIAEVDAELGLLSEPTVGGDSSANLETANLSMLEANATYEDENFSDGLYAEIVENNSYCLATGECGDVRYLFKDVLMVATVRDFGSTEVAIIPHGPVSKSLALTYARILDTDAAIDFSDGVIEDNSEGDSTVPLKITERYFEADLPAEGAAYSRASGLMVQLDLLPDGEAVSRIAFSRTVF